MKIMYTLKETGEKLGPQNNMDKITIIFFLTSWPHQHKTVINQFSPGRSSVCSVK